MHDKTLIIGLLVAMILAVGLLVFGVAKIVCGIASYHVRRRKTERQFQHAELGTLTSGDSLWTSEVQQSGRSIRIVVGGTETAPDEQLLEQTRIILGRFFEFERRAVEFLCNQEHGVGDSRLEFYALNVTDVQRPDDFTFEFLDSNDDSPVWRVEFVSGEPKHTGFDH